MHDKIDSVSEQNGKSSCAGTCPDVSSDALLSLGPENRYSQIPTIRIFLGKYHTYPSSLECETDGDGIDYHVTTILHYLRDELNHDITKDCIERVYHRLTKQKYVQTRLCDLGNGIMIKFENVRFESEIHNPNKLSVDHGDDYFLIVSQIKIYYLPEHDLFVQNLSDRFSQMTVFSSKSCTLQMVCRNDCGYYLRGIRIKKPLITDLALHYGQNFVGTHEKILKNLNQKESKGIVLLHGIPGSGNFEIISKVYIYIIVFIE
jgi:hypothetical protein